MWNATRKPRRRNSGQLLLFPLKLRNFRVPGTPARKENSHSRHLRLLFLRPSLQLTFKTNAGCLFAVKEPKNGCTHEYTRHGETSKKRRFERSIWIYHLRYFKFYITTTNCHSIVRRITNENFLIFQYEVEKKKLKIS